MKPESGMPPATALPGFFGACSGARSDSETLERANVLTSLYPMMPFSVNCWHAQNIYYSILDKVFPGMARRTADSRRWQERFLALGEKLQNQRTGSGAGGMDAGCKAS